MRSLTQHRLILFIHLDQSKKKMERGMKSPTLQTEVRCGDASLSINQEEAQIVTILELRTWSDTTVIFAAFTKPASADLPIS